MLFFENEESLAAYLGRDEDKSLAAQEAVKDLFLELEFIGYYRNATTLTIHHDGRIDFKPQTPEETNLAKSSHARYKHRLKRFKRYKKFPRLQHGFWWFLHNCIAHLAIGLFPCKATFWTHDYTSNKLNLKGLDEKPAHS